MNEYKEQLFQNLKSHLAGSGIYGVRHFDNGRDEIQLIFPDSTNVEKEFEGIYSLLESLPDIALPRERVYISFCHSGWADYRKILINPSEKDNRDATLIAHSPDKWLTPEEHRAYLEKSSHSN